MGETEFKPNGMAAAVGDAWAEVSALAEGEMRLTTPGGRYQVRWDDGGNATALGQLAFFAEFLEVSGPFERWVLSPAPSPRTPPPTRASAPRACACVPVPIPEPL